MKSKIIAWAGWIVALLTNILQYVSSNPLPAVTA